MNVINLIGRKFGKLKVIEKGITKRGGHENLTRIYWKCKCACGKIKDISGGHLRSGHTTSCGCSWYKFGENHKSWKGHEEISSRYFKSIISNSKVRNIDFNLTIEEIWNLFLKQNRKCSLSGMPLEFRANNGRIKGNASLDRKDSTKGYTIDNVQWVHSDINCMKWDMPQEKFLELCKMISECKR